MDIISLFRVAASSLLLNKSRSFLTILGIVIGVAAVITLVVIGDGLKEYVSGQFEGLGSNVVTVLPVNLVDERGRPVGFSGGPPVGGKIFSARDVRNIKRLDPAITQAIPLSNKRLKAETSGQQRTLDVTGSTYEYMAVRSITMVSGRFYDEIDVGRSKKVA